MNAFASLTNSVFTVAATATEPAIPTPQEMWLNLLDRGVTIAMLALALYLVGKYLLKTLGDKDVLFKEQINALKIDVQTFRADIIELRRQIRECEEDREELHKKIAELSKNSGKV